MLIAPGMQKKHGWDPELQKKKNISSNASCSWDAKEA